MKIDETGYELTMKVRLTHILLIGVCVLALGALLSAGGDSHPPGTDMVRVAVSLQEEQASTVPGDTLSTGTANGAENGHTDSFRPILLALALIIIAAIAGRYISSQLNMASVLGELLIGVLIGNIGYWIGFPLLILVMHLDSVGQMFGLVWSAGVSIPDAAQQVFSAEELAPEGIGTQIVHLFSGPAANDLMVMTYALWLFSNLGVILLLFMVGLESSVGEMLGVGPRALTVAVAGVVVPFALGFLTSTLLIPEGGTPMHLFLGATLSATSVGITARVFQDMNRIHTHEAKVILGAAVIDDVLGLIVLAIVAGIVATGSLDLVEAGRIVLVSFAFLAVAILFGERIFHWLIMKTSRFEKGWLKLLYPLVLVLLTSWLASMFGLASIVGAFVAGLLLKDSYFGESPRFRMTMEELIAPLEKLFAPVFFVLMGMQVNLSTFAQLDTVLLALGFIIVAIIGKVVAGYTVRGLDRLTVGIGMVPRGEVGLIFASVGKGLGVVSDSVFSAIVIMVIVTTLITPLALNWSISRGEKASSEPESP
jgi:Kef-type K+ transport system membrane component KefB